MPACTLRRAYICAIALGSRHNELIAIEPALPETRSLAKAQLG
jgi:hypothetical protein